MKLNNALARWQAIGAELASNSDIELDIETFAPICATFLQLRAAGHVFDPTLAALMGVLKRQGFPVDGEGDDDGEHKGTTRWCV